MPLSVLRKIGIARESSFGTSTAPAVALPVEDCIANVVFTPHKDEGERAHPAKTHAFYRGPQTTAIDLNGPVTPDEVGYLVRSLLGSETFTAATASDPATHVFTLNTSALPPSLSLQDEDGVRPMRFVGVYVTNIAITLDATAGFCAHTTSCAGKTYILNPSGTVPAYSATSAPLENWRATVKIGATSITNVSNTHLQLSRDVEYQYAPTNVVVPQALYPRWVEVAGQFTIEYDSVTDYDRYLNSTQESLTLELVKGSGTSKRGLKVFLPKVDFTDSVFQRSFQRAYIEATYSFSGILNTSTGSLVTIDLYTGRSTSF